MIVVALELPLVAGNLKARRPAVVGGEKEVVEIASRKRKKKKWVEFETQQVCRLESVILEIRIPERRLVVQTAISRLR